MDADVVCNGVWLKGIAGGLPDDVSTQEQWGQGASGGGCWTMSCSLPNMDPNFTYDCLATGARVEVYEHGTKTFDGWLDHLDRDSMKLTGKGWVQKAYDLLALEGSPGSEVASSTPNLAIDRAIAAGWPVKRVDDFCGTGIGNVAYVNRVTNLDTGTTTTTTQTFNSVGALLDAVALAAGMRWGVDADRVIVWYADKTTPDWILVPGAAVPGVTDPDFITDIYARFCYGYVRPQTTPSNAPGINAVVANGYLLYATAHVTDQPSIDLMGETREASVDLTALGPLPDISSGLPYSFNAGATNSPATTVAAGAVATALKNAQGRLDLVKARIGWTAPLNPTQYQLLTPGGSPAPLHLVRAGDLVSIHGTLTPSNQLDFGGHRDVVVSAVDYSAGSGVIKLEPLNMVSRDFGPALAAALADPGRPLPDDVDPGNTKWFTA